MVNPGEPPEITSSEFWLGPGAGTFFASAAQLEALAGMIIGMLGGHAAVQSALAVNWPAPTGEASVLANVPHMLWLGTVATMLQAAGGQIAATGEAFEMAKAATPTPAEVAYNQGEHVALNNANFLGFLTPYIAANRTQYGSYWVRGVANKTSYEAASAAGVQSIPPIPPPPPTAAPLTGGGGGAGAEPKATDALSGAQSPMEMMSSLLPMAMQLPSSLGQLASGGGPLKSLTELPKQAMEQVTSLSSQFGSSESGSGFADGSGGEGGDWITDTPTAGGPVTASLTGGAAGAGGGGMGGVGAMAGTSAATSLRSPPSWSSTVNAAGPAGSDTLAQASRIAEARTGTTVPASASGMGSPGAMMGPMAHGAAGAADSEKRQQGSNDPAAVLVSAANTFRSPDGLPTITGSGGTQFVATAKGGS